MRMVRGCVSVNVHVRVVVSCGWQCCYDCDCGCECASDADACVA